MIAAVLSAISVLAVGAAIRPRPRARRPERPTRAPKLLWQRWRFRHRAQFIEPGEIAVWCESLARVVRSGSSLTTAVRATAPPSCIARQVGIVVLALDRGSRLADALETESSSPHTHLAFTVLRACAINGGPPAEPLDRAAAALRGRAAAAAERQTQSAQARLSATVMTILPVAMLGLLLVTSATTRAAAGTQIGVFLIALGGVLNLGGWRWMQHIIRRVAS